MWLCGMGETSGNPRRFPSAKLPETGAVKIILEFFERSETLKVYLLRKRRETALLVRV
jgi:hypothetical protein